MIDVENAVFDHVYNSIYTAETPLLAPGCFQSIYVPQPPDLPFATLMEIDNRTDARRQTSSSDEAFAMISYEVNVYAASKYECRTVMHAIDEDMTALNFRRESCRFVPNLADSSIFRYTARYGAGANAEKTIFRT